MWLGGHSELQTHFLVCEIMDRFRSNFASLLLLAIYGLGL